MSPKPFDPDEWMKKQQGFDPDAWMESQQKSQPPAAPPAQPPPTQPPPTAQTAPAAKPPERAPTIAETMGWTSPWATVPADFIAGVGAGGASTVRGINTAAHKLIPQIPVVVPESATVAPETLPGQAGKFGEQAAEWLLPESKLAKVDKAIEAAKFLPRLTKPLVAAVPHAATAAGITGAQTGGDPDAMKWAALISGGARFAQPGIAATAQGVTGLMTGAGKAAVKKASEAAPEFMQAMRGRITESDILNHIRRGMEGIVNQRGAQYRAELAKLPQNLQLDLTPIKQEVAAALHDYGIVATNQGGQTVLDFSNSAIRNNATAETQIRGIVNDLGRWANTPGNLSPLGVDRLKRGIGDVLDSPGAPGALSKNAEGFVSRIYDSTKKLLNSVPGYENMTAGYEEASQLLRNMRDLSAHAANDGTAIRKFQSMMGDRNQYRRELLQQLSKYSGRDLEAEIAGLRMHPLAPQGWVGRLLDLGAGFGAYHGMPGLLPGMLASSPRIVGETAAKVGPLAEKYLPGTLGAMPRVVYEEKAEGGLITPKYQTRLTPQEETQFQGWVKKNKVPFDPSPQADYDMRGFWKGLTTGDPRAKTGISPYDGRMHFTDTWKTPYHKTFSNESIYAPPDAPHWEGDRLIDKNGNVVADETPQQPIRKQDGGAVSSQSNQSYLLPAVNVQSAWNAPQPPALLQRTPSREAQLAALASPSSYAPYPQPPREDLGYKVGNWFNEFLDVPQHAKNVTSGIKQIAEAPTWSERLKGASNVYHGGMGLANYMTAGTAIAAEPVKLVLENLGGLGAEKLADYGMEKALPEDTSEGTKAAISDVLEHYGEKYGPGFHHGEHAELRAKGGPIRMQDGGGYQTDWSFDPAPGQEILRRTPDREAVLRALKAAPQGHTAPYPLTPRSNPMETAAETFLNLSDMPASARQVGQGAKQLWNAPVNDPNAVLGGFSNVARGAMGLATPLLPASLATAPARTITSLVGGLGGQQLAERYLPQSLPEGTRNFAVDVASGLGGAAGHRFNLGQAVSDVRNLNFGSERGSIPIRRKAAAPPPLRRDITGQEVLAEAAKGPPSGIGGFSKYIERNPAAGQEVLDMSNAEAAIPGRPALPRYDPNLPPRKGAAPRTVDAFNNPDVIRGLRQYVQEGAQKLPANWYANSPLFKKFQEVWGDQAIPKFLQLMGYVSSTSSGMSVPNNVRTGSYYNWMAEQGMPFPEKPAKGYGAMMQKGHLQAARELQEQGAIDPIAHPKRGSFAENLAGNEDLLTADRHFWRLVGILSKDPRFLKDRLELEAKDPETGEKNVTVISPRQMFDSGAITMDQAVAEPTYWDDAPQTNEYQHAENQFRDKVAKPLGYTVADAQGKAWVGAGSVTGLGSPPETFGRVLAQRVAYTAARLNMDPKVVMEKFVRGQIPLLEVGAGAVGLGSLATQDQDGTDRRQ